MKNYMYLLVCGILLAGSSAVAMYVPKEGEAAGMVEADPIFLTEEGETLVPIVTYHRALEKFFPDNLVVEDAVTKAKKQLRDLVQDKIFTLNNMFEQKYGKSIKNLYQAIFQYFVEHPSFLLQHLGPVRYLASLGELYDQGIDINQPLIGSQITPLEYAIENNPVLVKFLLDNGAQLPAAVFQAAQKSKNPEILKLIFESTKEAR